MTRRPLVILSVVGGVLTLGACAQARPTYKSALATFLGAPPPKKLNDCRTCHSPAPSEDPSQVNGRTLNAYGRRLHEALPELRAAKKRAGISNRLEAVAGEDSDGDGASNLLELLVGRLPGDPKDTPSPEERQKGEDAVASFRAARSRQ
jgi:hypothetical protein